MALLRRQTLAEQTAGHLQEGFRVGRWSGRLPGVLRLSADLGVSKDTIRASLRLLERQGVLKSRGAGKRREILGGSRVGAGRRTLRVGILLSEDLAGDNSHSQRLIFTLKHRIESAGHVCVLAERSLIEMRHKLSRIARLVRETKADAWIAYAAPRALFEWFATQPIPVFAIGGRCQGLPIASSITDIRGAICSCVDTLVAAGHRRIVLISPPLWRHPTPSPAPEAFLARLQHHGLKTSEFNLPEWEETAEGLAGLLKTLFFATPPTAVLLAEPIYCPPLLTFLASRRMMIPRDLSLVCILSDPLLAMHRPAIAHFEYPLAAHVHDAVRWVEHVARGRADRAARVLDAKFMPGETIASPRK